MTIYSEFDVFLTGDQEFAKKFAETGKLLEKIEYPGVDHGFMYNQSFKFTPTFWKDLKLVIDEYVRC